MPPITTSSANRKVVSASPNPKARYLPPDLAERFQDMLERDDSLSMADAVAMLDVRETLLMERMNVPTPDFQRLQGLLSEVQLAHSAPTEEEFDGALARMRAAISIGISKEETWEEYLSLLSQRRLAVESERRRLVQERSVVTVEQARMLITRLLSIIDLLIDDRQLKARILSEFRNTMQLEGQANVIS